jgi:hypothetical protein
VRPAPIPLDAVWEGAQRVVMAAPNGDLTDDTIVPVLGVGDHQGRCTCVNGTIAMLVTNPYLFPDADGEPGVLIAGPYRTVLMSWPQYAALAEDEPAYASFLRTFETGGAK